MVSITTIERRTPPEWSKTTADAGAYTAKWHITMSDITIGSVVVKLGQINATNERLPKDRESLNWVGGSATYHDPNVFALEFRATPFVNFVDYPHDWLVTVTWRVPKEGADEQPENADKPPLARTPEYWVEYNSDQEEIVDGWNEQQFGLGIGGNIRPRNQLGPLTTAAGEKVEGLFKDRTRLVLFQQRNVSSPRVALRLMNRFENTTNENVWKTPFLTVQPRFARFLRAETTPEVRDTGQKFFRMRTSVEIAREAYKIKVPNRGTIYLGPVDGKFQRLQNRDTDGVIQEVNLTSSGVRTQREPPGTIDYFIYDEANYNAMNF